MLVSGILIMSFMYIFLIQKAIVNVVEREKIIKEIKEKSSNINELETEYLSLKSVINIELAHTKGFKDPENIAYISKKPIKEFALHNEL